RSRATSRTAAPLRPIRRAPEPRSEPAADVLRQGRGVSGGVLVRCRWCGSRASRRRTAPPENVGSAALNETDRTRNAGPAEPAIAIRILGQVLLVVCLGIIKCGRVCDLRRDSAVAPRLEPLGIRVA